MPATAATVSIIAPVLVAVVRPDPPLISIPVRVAQR